MTDWEALVAKYNSRGSSLVGGRGRDPSIRLMSTAKPPPTVVPGGNYRGYQPGTGVNPSPTQPPKKKTSPAPAPAPPPVPQDYTAILGSDPALKSTLDALYQQGTADQGALTAARQAALIQYGAIPDVPWDERLLGGVGADITPGVSAQAAEATRGGTSTVAQLAANYKREQSGDVASLIGRNSLRSGDYRRLSRENTQGYQINKANAQQQLLSQLGGLWNSFGERQQGLADRAATANSDALARIIGQIQAGTIGGGGGAASTPPPKTKTKPAPKNPAPKPTPAPKKPAPPPYRYKPLP